MSIDTTKSKSWTPEKLENVKIFTPKTVVKDKRDNVVAWLSTKQLSTKQKGE